MTLPAPLLPAVGDSAYWAAGTLEVDGVLFSTSPWVRGMRSAAFYGPVSAELLVSAEDFGDAESELLAALGAKALRLRANACVGLEVTIDPWAADGTRVWLHAVGTAAKLEPLT